ncbi:MAG: cyclic nucleotide-binding domain-containing protein [Nitrospinae bacterium]|nr:cyclic nucleotide-binding domain-containing protein [Nitrospinota bacterium]
MDIAGIKNIMCEIPMFDNIKQSDIAVLASKLELRRYPANTMVAREGSPGDSVLFITSGKLEIRKESLDGKYTVLAQHGKGKSVGEMALVRGNATPRGASIVATELTEALVLSRKNFEVLIEKNPPIAIQILRNIAAAISDRLDHLGSRYADKQQ